MDNIVQIAIKLILMIITILILIGACIFGAYIAIATIIPWILI